MTKFFTNSETLTYIYIYINKVRIRNSAEIFWVWTELSTNFAQVVIKSDDMLTLIVPEMVH